MPGALIFMAIISLAWWMSYDPVKNLVPSVPGMDNRGEGVAAALNVEIGSLHERFQDQSTELPGRPLRENWPRFRGVQFDNISRSDVSLIDQFPEGGPDIKWSVHLGEGHGGAAIYDGRVYILDYLEEERADMLRCFDLISGSEIWRRGYKVPVKRNHGMSRTVPAVTGEHILTIGPRGHVMCTRRESGEFLWGLDIVKEYDSEIPFWYTGQCPLIDEGKAIIATGGSSLLVALDCETGDILWETPNEHNWGMSHSSVMPYTYAGKKMYVYSAIGGAVGIAAEGRDAGSVLWSTREWNHNVVAPSPVCLPDGKIFLTAGYGAGSMALQLNESGGKFGVEVLQEYTPREGMSCEQQTPVLFQGHLIGIQPKDAGPLRNQMVCVHPDDFQTMVWSSGQTVRFGLGPYMIADDKMFILDDDGTLIIAKPSLSEYIELDRYRVIEDGQDAWAPIALADGYMVLRDSETMVCMDMSESRNY